jgi:hypothetical protein
MVFVLSSWSTEDDDDDDDDDVARIQMLARPVGTSTDSKHGIMPTRSYIGTRGWKRVYTTFRSGPWAVQRRRARRGLAGTIKEWKAGCWFADRQKRMAVAGAGLTRVTKIGKETTEGPQQRMGIWMAVQCTVGGLDFGALIDCDSANGTSELVLLPRPLP